MAFDLGRIRRELESVPPEGPLGLEVALAVLADLLRDAGARPPTAAALRTLVASGSRPENRPPQLGALAHILSVTSLRVESLAVLRTRGAVDAVAMLESFLETVWPLTAQLILENPFRQEELLRRWVVIVGGQIDGEEPGESARRLEQLDYRKTLVEYDKAERARLAEAQKRAQALRKAREEAEEAARGWRE